MSAPFRITGAGLYKQIAEGDYHADPCPEPSLSSSLIKVLLNQSPRHAWSAHPRLNARHRPTYKAIFDIGSVFHTCALGAGEVVVLDFPDYKTKAAKVARDAARDAGATPILAKDMVEINAMVEAFKAQLIHTELRGILDNGQPEQTLIWQEGDIWCRCRLDWMAVDRHGKPAGTVFLDLKSTGLSADPESFKRQCFNLGYDIQWAFYRRGIQQVLGIADPVFVFVVQETSPPYGLSLNTLDAHAGEIADGRVARAIDLWSWCLKNDAWPGYSRHTAHLDAPAWWAQRHELDNHTHAALGGDLLQTMINWQAPLEKEDA